jgi:hypothetical protein
VVWGVRDFRLLIFFGFSKSNLMAKESFEKLGFFDEESEHSKASSLPPTRQST